MSRNPINDPLRSTGDGGENPKSHQDRDQAYGRVPQAPQDPDVSRSRMFSDVSDENGFASYDLPGGIGDGMKGGFHHADYDSVRETNVIEHGTSAAFNVAEHISVNVSDAKVGDSLGASGNFDHSGNPPGSRPRPSSYIKDNLWRAEADENTDPGQV